MDFKPSVQLEKSDGQLSVLLSYSMLLISLISEERTTFGNQIKQRVPMGFGQFDE